jgi:hypothetical protein
MTKISDIVFHEDSIDICLSSGISKCFKVVSCEYDILKSVSDKIIGVEIFDQPSIDNIICISDNRTAIFNLSKLFLSLAALEFGTSISNYVGFSKYIPKVFYVVSSDQVYEKISCTSSRNDLSNIFLYCIHSDFIDYNGSTYFIFNIDNCFTITEVVQFVLSSKIPLIFESDDLIVCDLAIGLGIPYIKTRNISILDVLNS